MTMEQVLDLKLGNILHFSSCNIRRIERWRVNGKVKTWKRDPDRFEVPIKRGLSRYSRLDRANAHLFHLESECPIENLARVGH